MNDRMEWKHRSRCKFHLQFSRIIIGSLPRPMRFYLDPVLPGVRPRVWLRKFAIATRERSSGYHRTVREIFPIEKKIEERREREREEEININLGRGCIMTGARNSSSPIIIRFWSGIGHDRWLARMKIGGVNENGRAFGNIANDLGMNGGLLVIRMIGGIRRPIVILWTIAFGIGTRLLGRFRVTVFTDGARDYRRVPIRQRSGGRCGGGRCTVRIRA